jgi:DNA mismatch repair protein MutS
MEKVTPLRQQYLGVKRKYPEAIVLFRLGDFYETFDEDAKVVARELEIVLTSREMGKGKRVPMAGIPYHALDNYLARLINRGHHVAICEQLTPPGNGLVERDVVRVVTPGTVVESNLLDGNANNYLASVVVDADSAGIAYVDITTSEFATTQLSRQHVLPELGRLAPSEIIAPRNALFADTLPSDSLTFADEQWFDLEEASQALLQHFGVATLEGYGCANLPLAIRAAGAVLQYLSETQRGALSQLGWLSTYNTDSFMVLDAHTRRNLELFHSGREETSSPSLLSVLDLTKTAMGGRLLKRWLGLPLLNLDDLIQRQNAVEGFYIDGLARGKTSLMLGQMADLERLTNRVRGGRATPKELVALRGSLEVIPAIVDTLKEATGVDFCTSRLGSCDEVVDLISRAIADDPPPTLEEGGVVREGFSAELDQLCSASRDAKDYLAQLEKRERQRTGIKSLKVGYNRVFGYYIEVSKANMGQVPENYIRKQTLTGAERFFTPELKDYESLILNARERSIELESALFRQVCQQVGSWAERIMTVADAIAQLDVLASLAEVAIRNHYTRPTLTNDDVISISGGRHPVVETTTKDTGFVPNDTQLSNRDAQIIVLTGPNMSGKSTYLRQVATIVLMAQIGSFVPADSATIGIVDRIFTRIGAQEDLAAGQSTFMVEMVETAIILNNATPQSLIILDEIGRGTSTYDGLSIAHAVVEYLHNHPRQAAKTLFATHYHELVELASYLPRVRNLNVAVTEEKGQVVFLRKIIPGGADKSYGIHVAQLAGLPKSVVRRAQEVLDTLESDSYAVAGPSPKLHRPPAAPQLQPQQMTFFGKPSAVLEDLLALDVDSITPMEALNKMYELQHRAKDDPTISGL